MKYIFLSVLFFLISGIFSFASAHDPNLPPFLKINGVITRQYPVPDTLVNSEEFVIPQDIASEVYFVNTDIEFLLEEAQLPIVPDMIKTGSFLWDFGDGGTGEGLQITHAYTKSGSYIQRVYFTISDLEQPVLLQSTLLHIVPEKGYQIPQAILSIGGTKVTDPYNQIVTVPLKDPVTFDASGSTASGKIVEYLWELGDEKVRKTNEPTISHEYNEKELEEGLSVIFVAMRIKTADGFFADTYGQIENDMTAEAIAKKNDWKNTAKFVGMILGIGLVLAGAGYFAQKIIKFK